MELMHAPDDANRRGPPRKGGFRRALAWLNEFEYAVGSVALLGLVFMLAVTIIARYIGGMSIPWTEEVARFIFIALIFSSISFSARFFRHIRVTFFVERFLSDHLRRVVLIFGDLIWLCFNTAVLYGAYVIISDMYRYPYNSAVLNLPMYYVYAIIPIFYVTLSIRVIQGIVARLRGEEIDLHKEDTL
jgi:TRAP-type C4-dicarboxylate transport system permease small subunit